MAVAQAPRETTPEGRIKDEDLMDLARDGHKREMVDGRLQGVAASEKHGQIVIWLRRLVGPYADDCGILTASQAGFWMAAGTRTKQRGHLPPDP